MAAAWTPWSVAASTCSACACGSAMALISARAQFGKGLALLRFQVSAPVAPLATFILARLGERVDGSLGKGDRGRNPVAA